MDMTRDALTLVSVRSRSSESYVVFISNVSVSPSSGLSIPSTWMKMFPGICFSAVTALMVVPVRIQLSKYLIEPLTLHCGLIGRDL